MQGGAWKESWTEKVYAPSGVAAGGKCIERSAHKWAVSADRKEWEEKWGEFYSSAGPVNKWADKWAKEGANVWHERWGEDYDGGGACQKWTDKWAERLLEGGAREQWGDKWTETFGQQGPGKGSKHGEVWSADAGGGRYHRWWNEEHAGDGAVRKYGNSTSGEHWDVWEHMDTYYNPVPHFGYDLAAAHSPTLMGLPELPRVPGGRSRSTADLGDGLDSF